MAGDPRIQLATRALLGPVRVLADASLPPHLLRVRDGRGAAYIVKRHRRPERFASEVHAYRTWRPHLQSHAPDMVAHHLGSLTILLTALPGHALSTLTQSPGMDEAAYQAAGRTLSLLHAAPQSRRGLAVGQHLAARLHYWTRLAADADLLAPAERSALHRVADALSSTPMESGVCHLDYQPRNWLVSASGFWTFDFEHMRHDARIRDFARLEFRHWQHAPQLREAFWDGYGRLPTRDEEHLLTQFGALEAATALVRGHQTADAELLAHGRTVLTRLT